MINGKKILAIIPARGGSKGLPGKNVKMIAGKPLIAWTIEEAKKSKYIDRLILSSEDEKIIQIAQEYSCEVPFVRPKELAEDYTPGIDPVLHALENLEKKYDYVCLLQPTSPLRTVNDIDECIQRCFLTESESCVSVTEVDKHPFLMFDINTDGKLVQLFKNEKLQRRQEMPLKYALNGAIYFIKTYSLFANRKFINDNTTAYIMKKENSIDIDDRIDFMLAELQIKERIKNEP